MSLVQTFPSGGEDGVGISAITFKETDAQGNNVYTITLSNNTTYDFTAPRGPQGATGQTGATGATGPQGPTGIGLLNYSTSEQYTGIKWNNLKIYQKSFTGSLGNSPQDGVVIMTLPVGSALIDARGIVTMSSGIAVVTPYGTSTDDWAAIWSESNRSVKVGGDAAQKKNASYQVTVWYTKTS